MKGTELAEKVDALGAYCVDCLVNERLRELSTADRRRTSTAQYSDVRDFAKVSDPRS